MALVRTGLAILVLGLTLFRYFGVSIWSAFDGALVLLGIGLVIYGGKGYREADRKDKRFLELLSADVGFQDLV